MNQQVLSKLKAWKESPLLFTKEAIGVEPSSQQADGLAKFPHTKRMTIRSGHGTGKDAFASWIILWFLCTRSYPKILCTAPTGRQLNDILWAELSKWIRKSILADEFVIQSEKIFHKDAPREWWARAVTASIKTSAEEQAETLAGLHADHMLIVCDEASGIPDPVYLPLEGAMTQEDNRCLIIGNMTRNKGYFYDTHFDPTQSKLFTRLHWDSRESTNVAQSMVDYFSTKYGEDSNVFKIRVMGDPPIDDEYSLIPLHWAQQCVGNDIPVYDEDPRVIGVDVARYGDDKSIILPRIGNTIKRWESYHELNPINLAMLTKEEFYNFEADRVGVDEIGVGGPVLDWLHLNGLLREAVGVNVATKASDASRFYRLRDELWWKVREKCMNAQYNFPVGSDGEELCDELSSVRFEESEGKNAVIKVESKKQMRFRGVSSPNIADALCITEFFYSGFVGSLVKPEMFTVKKKKQRASMSEVYGRDAWMVV